MPEDYDSFTDAQDEAVRRAYQLLCEHFDSCLIIVGTEVEEDGSGADGNQLFWSGGYCNAIGLAEYAKHKMLMESDLRDKDREP